MAGKVFINYRRGDDPGYTLALYQRLEEEFSADGLFMDVEGHIHPGDDFVEVLNEQVAASDILLVVIGPRWLELLRERFDDLNDFVQIEIAAALEKRKRVVPVLVGGSNIPSADNLPERIRPLVRRNAVGLGPERFRADCQGLIAALKKQLVEAASERAAKTKAELEAAEDARRKREEEEAARIVAAEIRAREQASAGVSSDKMREAEELTNWKIVERRDDVAELRDHLARFPGGVKERFAQDKLEQLVWAAVRTAPSHDTIENYLKEFPKGGYAIEALSLLSDLKFHKPEEGLQQIKIDFQEYQLPTAGRIGERNLILVAVLTSVGSVVAIVTGVVWIGRMLMIGGVFR